jgi:hypothetical protein
MTPPETAYFEALQVEADEPVRARRNPIKWALWATAIALVGAHPLWLRAGMPVPSFLTPILEILHV